jgi:MFS family permease
LIDKIGNRSAALLFCTLIAIGSLVVAGAPSLPNSSPFFIYLLMLTGRFVFGIGSEASYVVQNSMCVEWFQGRHLAKAMAFTTTIARLGSIMAFNTELTISTYFGNYLHALWFASLTCVFSLVTCMVYVIMDRWAKLTYQKNGGIVVEAESNKVTFRDLKRLSSRYWLCAAIATTIYTAIYTFRSLSSPYISRKFDYDNEWALFCVSIIDISSMLTSSLFGWLVDRTGYRGYLVIVGNVLAVVGFLVIGLTELNPLVAVVLLGIHFALMPAALWPGIAILVDQRIEGTAFAFVSALINLGTSVMFPIAGYVGDSLGFQFFCLLLAFLSGISVTLAIMWNIVDARNQTPVLNVRSR